MLMNLYGKTESNEMWWSYLANYEKGAGSTVVNLELKKRCPEPKFRYLVVTGVSYTSSKELPDGQELDKLNAISSKRLKFMQEHTSSILAGTFTHDSERLDYIYVSNTSGIENALKEFYKQNCPDRKTYINVKDDAKWEAYLDFLFPNEQTIKFYREELVKIGYLDKNGNLK